MGPLNVTPSSDWNTLANNTSVWTAEQQPTNAGADAPSHVNGSLIDDADIAGSHSELTALSITLIGVVVPIISLIGVVTNMANAVVLASMIKRKRTPVYHILLAMAVADFLSMGVMLLYSVRFYSRAHPIMLRRDAENIDLPSHFFFHTWDTFANVCGMASNWCTVAMAAFRFVAVYFPLQAPVLCTRRRAQVTIVLVFAGSVAMNVPRALVDQYQPSTGRFVLQQELEDRYKKTYYVALVVVYHVLPWIISTALVALLLLGLWSQQRLVRASSKQEKQKNVEQRKLSLTLTSVAAWFIVSTAPMVIYTLMGFASPESFPYQISSLRFYFAAATLTAINYASNFFMYAFINRTYRTQLASIVRCRNAPSTSTTTATNFTKIEA